MTVHQQYIDLYRSQRAMIDANAAPVLNAQRDGAAEVLARVGLSRPKDFTQVDPEELLATDYSINLARHEVPTSREDLFSCAVPELSTDVHFLVNEQYVDNAASRKGNTQLPSVPRKQMPLGQEGAGVGLFAGSLRRFALEHPDIAERYYNRLAMRDDPHYDERANHTPVTAHRPLGEAALNTLLCQDGFVLYVPDGVTVEKPLQLISLLRAVEDFMACQRILIILGEGAKASVLMCDHASRLAADGSVAADGAATAQLLSLQVTEIFAGRDAHLDFYQLEEHHDQCRRLSSVYVGQESGSNVALGNYTLTAGQTRNRVYIDFRAPGATTSLYGLCIADQQQMVDNITYIRHRCEACQSNELFKYVLDDQARGSFVGRVLVQQGAVKTDAHQTDRNLCLTPEARMVARPELEIYADDVKCSHGATVGQLDQQALYYMRTRGIPEAEARLLLMTAFMSDVIDGIRIEPLRDRLRHLVEKRLRGELTQCKSCVVRK